MQIDLECETFRINLNVISLDLAIFSAFLRYKINSISFSWLYQDILLMKDEDKFEKLEDITRHWPLLTES